MKLVFATNNKDKLNEIQKLLGMDFELISLQDIGCYSDLPENQTTLEGNASEKAMYIYSLYNMNCFADDTGLEIEALNGAPGVFSARYAGENKNMEENIRKALSELKGKTNRKARFRTVISLVMDGKVKLFEGIVNGTILEEKRGRLGFGYDPIFVPDGYHQTFAEMPLSEKNNISHRGIAIRKLADFLTLNTSFFGNKK